MASRLVLAFFGLLLAGSTLEAREYPWCASYDAYTSNCGFTTYEQCRATILGAGGICRPNPRAFYSPGPEERPRRERDPRR